MRGHPHYIFLLFERYYLPFSSPVKNKRGYLLNVYRRFLKTSFNTNCFFQLLLIDTIDFTESG